MSERKTGRTGSAGRFGARYGRVSRRRVAEIERDTNADHACPECGEKRVSRDGTAVWSCSRCGHTFTGGTYRPETPGGKTAKRSIRAALSEGEEAESEQAAASEGETAADAADEPAVEDR